MDKYIVFIFDSLSFDMYDLNSGYEKFCMTYDETCEAISKDIPRIVTPSISNLSNWERYIDLGYRVYIMKNNKKVEIYEGLNNLRRYCRADSFLLKGIFDDLFTN